MKSLPEPEYYTYPTTRGTIKDGQLEVTERVITNQRGSFNQSERRIQSVAIMVKRLFEGKSIEAVAGELGLSTTQVMKRIKQAREDGVPETVRDYTINEMLPESMVVLKEALQGPDLKLATSVALEITKRLKAMDSPEAVAQLDADETLELWRAKITKKAEPKSIRGEVSVMRGDDNE